MPRVRIQVVGSEAGAHELGRGIAFEDRPLSRAEHAERSRALFPEYGFRTRGHHVESLVPSDGREFAVFVEDPVLHAQKGCRETVILDRK
jgi:hypothetical protein